MVTSDPAVVNPVAVLFWLCHVRISYMPWYGNAFRNVTSITIIVIAGKVYNIYIIIAADIKW